MRGRGILVGALTLLLGLSGSGCVTPAGKQAAPEPSGLSEVDPGRIAGDFISRARDLESRGLPVRALRQYRIALTVDPESREALEAAGRLESDLSARADERCRIGLEFHKQGKYDQARRRFLAALRLKPDHPTAAGMLVSRKRIRSTRYVVHQVAPGESLSALAQRYYGDYRKFPEIARYNSLSDATRLMVGQALRIPEIEGVPFHIGGVEVQTEEEIPAEAGLWEWGGLEATAWAQGDEAAEEAREKARTAACLANGIALFDRKKYRQAVEELEQVLIAAPEDEIARDYAFKAHFRLAEDLFEKKQYLAARERFLASLRLRKDCAICHRYVERCEELFKEAHYRRGMQFYNQEKLLEAIREWERVQDLDPNYKRVGYLIEKAGTILSNLEDLKRAQRKQP
ncbi:MAG: tetratricopeptide repeat protein [Deltaproteobacteria bacterium]|nr:tetratricopeptide repeat protein [Deltaproteobacteria bacterium]